MAPGRDWLALPDEILELIASRLTLIIDYVRLGCVCKTWRLVVSNNQQKQKLPFLVLPTLQNCGVYSLSEFQVVSYFTLPLPHDKHCLGSAPGGWLLAAKCCDHTISLFNPFSSLEILLPPLPPTIGSSYHVNQAFFFSPIAAPLLPEQEDSVVMIIYDDRLQLAFCKPGGGQWAIVDGVQDLAIHDVIYYKTQFYAVKSDGTLLICNIDSPRPNLSKFANRPDYKSDGHNTPAHHFPTRFLVESISGKLLQVMGFYDIYSEVESMDFIVFELQWPDEKGTAMRWVRVPHLGDQMLFLGNNNSLCLSASNFPSFKGNCIYFTLDKMMFLVNENVDNGVFDLADKSIRPYYKRPDKRLIHSMALWVMPPLI